MSVRSNELLKNITENLETQLLEFYSFTDSLEEIPEEIRLILEVPLCKVTRRVIPHVRTKIDEIIRADEENLNINLGLHGHDLFNGEDHYEEKTSQVLKKTKKCNFLWPIPVGSSPEERKKKLLASVYQKTIGGGAIFTIVDNMQKIVKQYRFSHAFLMIYFENLPLTGKEQKHNFGSSFCWTCKSCPRLNKIELAQVVLEKKDEINWKIVFEKTKKHECKGSDT